MVEISVPFIHQQLFLYFSVTFFMDEFAYIFLALVIRNKLFFFLNINYKFGYKLTDRNLGTYDTVFENNKFNPKYFQIFQRHQNLQLKINIVIFFE